MSNFHEIPLRTKEHSHFFKLNDEVCISEKGCLFKHVMGSDKATSKKKNLFFQYNWIKEAPAYRGVGEVLD
jgi:hypothetical protein